MWADSNARANMRKAADLWKRLRPRLFRRRENPTIRNHRTNVQPTNWLDLDAVSEAGHRAELAVAERQRLRGKRTR